MFFILMRFKDEKAVSVAEKYAEHNTNIPILIIEAILSLSIKVLIPSKYN